MSPCSKWDPWRTSSHITWELFRKAESQAPPQTYGISLYIATSVPRGLLHTRKCEFQESQESMRHHPAPGMRLSLSKTV